MSTAPAQFADALHRHQARVYSIAFRILGESGVAEEVAQDVFLELHRRLSRLESEDHIVAWLRRVTCHRATDALRRMTVRRGAVHDELDENILSMPEPPAPSPLMNRIERLLFTLSPAQRAVIILRYQEDMEPEDIAIELAMPLATVRSHLQRALKLLRGKAERTLNDRPDDLEFLERDLRESLATRPAPPDFAAKVLAAVSARETGKASRPAFFYAWRRTLAAVLIAAALLSAAAWQHQRSRRIAGERARAQVFLALRITNSTLDAILQQKIQHTSKEAQP